MNEIQCWYCKKWFKYEGEKYRDIVCSHCKVLNTIFNPAEQRSYESDGSEEEDMLDYGNEKYQGKYVYLPKVGETAEFDIKEVREAKSDNPRINFSEKVPVMQGGVQVVDDDGEDVFKEKDLGYHVEAELENGKILSVTSYSAFAATFKKHMIQDGDKVLIKHIDKGKWEVTKLNDA